MKNFIFIIVAFLFIFILIVSCSSEQKLSDYKDKIKEIDEDWNDYREGKITTLEEVASEYPEDFSPTEQLEILIKYLVPKAEIMYERLSELDVPDRYKEFHNYYSSYFKYVIKCKDAENEEIFAYLDEANDNLEKAYSMFPY